MDAVKPLHSTTASYDGVPFLGVIPDMIRKGPYKFLNDAIEHYGELPKMKFGTATAYLVTNPDHYQHILRDNHHNYIKPDLFYGALREILGNGLVTSDGDFWLRQRRLIQPHLHRKYLAELGIIMRRAICRVLDSWQAGQTVSAQKQMSRITMDVITQTMFGTDVLTPEEMDIVNAKMPHVLEYINVRGFLPIPKWIKLPIDRDFEHTLATIRRIVYRLIDVRRSNPNDSVDLITMLIHAVDEETSESMSNEQLFDEAMTIFLAGFETTATALLWFCCLLESFPDVEAKLREELAEVVGDNEIGVEHVHQLQYHRMVLQELMRHRTPVGLLPRQALDDDMLGDYPIKKGDYFLLYYHGLHHNPNVWENPDEFDPNRFSEENSSERSRFAFIPFSAGPRQCVGNEFALMEGILAMAMILQRYHIKVEANPNLNPKLRTVLKPTGDVKVIFEAV